MKGCDIYILQRVEQTCSASTRTRPSSVLTKKHRAIASPLEYIVVRSSHRGSVALIDATTAGYKREKSQSNLYEAALQPYIQYSVPSLLNALSCIRERESDRVYKNGA